MNLVKHLLAFLFILFSYNIVPAQVPESIDEVIENIEEAGNVGILYTARTRIHRFENKSNSSVGDLKKIKDAYRKLSDGFSSFNHYRNAAEVYKEYLNANEIFLLQRNKLEIDSVKSRHRQITDIESELIRKLDAELKELESTRVKVAGLKRNYFIWGALAAAGIVVLFFLIYTSRNRSIVQTNKDLESTRERMLQINGKVIKARMETGSLHYALATAGTTVETLDEIIASTTPAESKSLQRVREIMATIKN